MGYVVAGESLCRLVLVGRSLTRIMQEKIAVNDSGRLVYIGVEFSEEHRHLLDVYDGKLLKFLRYIFPLNECSFIKDFILLDWASGLFIHQYLQVFKMGTVGVAVSNSTVEDVKIVPHSIRQLEHRTTQKGEGHTLLKICSVLPARFWKKNKHNQPE